MGGIAAFMQKIFTAYTMYFNKKNKRAGALFSGSYKSKHLYSDRYLKHCLAYVMLNPVELFEPEWKQGRAIIGNLRQRLIDYHFSSLPDFMNRKRPENKIVADLANLYDHKPTLEEVLTDAHAYHVANPTPKV